MPGPQVKNWDMYHALRERGHSKESAARITNSQAGKKSRLSKKGKKRKRGKLHKKGKK